VYKSEVLKLMKHISFTGDRDNFIVMLLIIWKFHDCCFQCPSLSTTKKCRLQANSHMSVIISTGCTIL